MGRRQPGRITPARLHSFTPARLHACTSARLHVCTSARLHACTPARLPIWTPIHLPLHLHTFTPVHLTAVCARHPPWPGSGGRGGTVRDLAGQQSIQGASHLPCTLYLTCTFYLGPCTLYNVQCKWGLHLESLLHIRYITLYLHCILHNYGCIGHHHYTLHYILPVLYSYPLGFYLTSLWHSCCSILYLHCIHIYHGCIWRHHDTVTTLLYTYTVFLTIMAVFYPTMTQSLHYIVPALYSSKGSISIVRDISEWAPFQPGDIRGS